MRGLRRVRHKPPPHENDGQGTGHLQEVEEVPARGMGKEVAAALEAREPDHLQGPEDIHGGDAEQRREPDEVEVEDGDAKDRGTVGLDVPALTTEPAFRDSSLLYGIAACLNFSACFSGFKPACTG